MRARRLFQFPIVPMQISKNAFPVPKKWSDPFGVTCATLNSLTSPFEFEEGVEQCAPSKNLLERLFFRALAWALGEKGQLKIQLKKKGKVSNNSESLYGFQIHLFCLPREWGVIFYGILGSYLLLLPSMSFPLPHDLSPVKEHSGKKSVSKG